MVGALRRPVRIGNNYYLGINLPEQYGGHGLSHLDAVIVLEEFAKVSPAVAFPVFESCFGPILAIAHFAPETLRTRLILQVVAGKSIVAVAMSEPEAGSALTDLRTRAIVQGALDYVLDYVQQRKIGRAHV